MNQESVQFEDTLDKLKKYDGKLWLRILGQTHWQYNELPFWVLMKDRGQIEHAFPVLQKILRPLQDAYSADANITISFITFNDSLDCSYGMFIGEEFFERDAIDKLYREPECSTRETGIFDEEYPDDPWSISK